MKPLIQSHMTMSDEELQKSRELKREIASYLINMGITFTISNRRVEIPGIKFVQLEDALAWCESAFKRQMEERLQYSIERANAV